MKLMTNYTTHNSKIKILKINKIGQSLSQLFMLAFRWRNDQNLSLVHRRREVWAECFPTARIGLIRNHNLSTFIFVWNFYYRLAVIIFVKKYVDIQELMIELLTTCLRDQTFYHVNQIIIGFWLVRYIHKLYLIKNIVNSDKATWWWRISL